MREGGIERETNYRGEIVKEKLVMRR